MGDACAAGFCVGMGMSCDDGLPCTIDPCDAGVCLKTIVAANTCLIGGACHYDGAFDPDNSCQLCDAADNPTKWKHTEVASCSDGDPCTLEDHCDKGQCKSKDLNCDDGSDCTVDSCDPEAQGCKWALLTGDCDDGNACTKADMCVAGICAGNVGTDCDDGNLCTNDLCSPKDGCFHVNNSAPCDDGDECTFPDKCKGGQCDGSPKGCSDNDPCTVDDTCDGADGNSCVGTPMLCSDDNLCTADSCLEGACVSTPSDGLGCTDGDLCTMLDTCIDGLCKGTVVMDCDDGMPCTSDDCSGGVCVSSPVLCDDGRTCTVDSCGENGICDHVYDPTSDACFIDGTCWESGAANPEDPCQKCFPDLEHDGWTVIAMCP